jgi:hypothetical protein
VRDGENRSSCAVPFRHPDRIAPQHPALPPGLIRDGCGGQTEFVTAEPEMPEPWRGGAVRDTARQPLPPAGTCFVNLSGGRAGGGLVNPEIQRCLERLATLARVAEAREDERGELQAEQRELGERSSTERDNIIGQYQQ